MNGRWKSSLVSSDRHLWCRHQYYPWSWHCWLCAKRMPTRPALCPYCGSTSVLLTTSCSNTTNLIAYHYRTTGGKYTATARLNNNDKKASKIRVNPVLWKNMLGNIKFLYSSFKSSNKSFFCGICAMIPVGKAYIILQLNMFCWIVSAQ